MLLGSSFHPSGHGGGFSYLASSGQRMPLALLVPPPGGRHGHGGRIVPEWLWSGSGSFVRQAC